ncbi:MAG: transketolase C-terminal domain-containing protein [Spirochaetia bacterium]|jgi:transketolase
MEQARKQDLREVMVQALIRAVDEGKNLVVVVSDSASTSQIGPFQSRFPERLINVGIAEQNLMGIAAGLSLGGYTAVTANAAPFATSRANEQLKNDICYSRTNVKVMGLHAGVAYGPLASTHHAIDDISILRGLGNILIFAPSDPPEADGVFRYSFDYDGPVYVRMDNVAFPFLHEPGYHFQPGKVDILKEGEDLAIFSMGSVTWEAHSAGEALVRLGIHAEIINVPSIRPADPEGIYRSALKTGRVLTVEEHSVHGGLGSLVSEVLAERGAGVRVSRLGIPEGEFSKAGPRSAIRAYYGIDKDGILRKALEVLGRTA